MFLHTVTVLLLTLQSSTGFKIRVADAPKVCGEGHQYMGYTARKTFLQAHNEKRASLAEGNQGLPPAKNMRFLAYNCDLEKEATELTQKCKDFPSEAQFNRTTTNVAKILSLISNGPITAAEQAVSDWWKNKPGAGQVPTIPKDDDSTIPFFLMAQAETDEVGCSVSSCKEDDESSYYTIACIYGTTVEAGRDLYQEGQACSACTEDYPCFQDALCKKPLK